MGEARKLRRASCDRPAVHGRMLRLNSYDRANALPPIANDRNGSKVAISGRSAIGQDRLWPRSTDCGHSCKNGPNWNCRQRSKPLADDVSLVNCLWMKLASEPGSNEMSTLRFHSTPRCFGLVHIGPLGDGALNPYRLNTSPTWQEPSRPWRCQMLGPANRMRWSL